MSKERYEREQERVIEVSAMKIDDAKSNIKQV